MRPHPRLYEISTVPWLSELSRARGQRVTLARVAAAEWDRLGDLGFDYVWLMGIWRKSAVGRAIFREATELYPVYDAALPGWSMDDVIGSPYSVRAYEPDPDVGGWDDVDAARAELAKRGMGLILDFVPNHTGPDHAWVRQRPSVYLQGGARDYESDPAAFFVVEGGATPRYVAKGRDPYFAPWNDTAQINYFHPDARAAMIDTLRTIARHSDGVRCDMAMLVLNDIFARTWGKLLEQPAPAREFWEEARAATPGMLWIAEAYWDTEYTLQTLGFDYVYDKRLYDRCLGAPAEEIRLHLAADDAYQNRLVRFIENHDEPRSAAVFAPGRLRAAATLVATLPGLKLFNQGQLEGKKIHLPVQLVRAMEEPVNEELRDFYRRLLSATDDRAFHDGRWRLLAAQPFVDDSHRDLICHAWRCDGELRLVVNNFRDGWAQGRVVLRDFIDPGRSYRLHDLLSGETYERNGAEMCGEGLHVVLANHASHILRFD